MKNTILTTFFLFFITFLLAQNNNLGLVSRIVEIKYYSEAHMAMLDSDNSVSEQTKAEAKEKFNELRLALDGIILQLICDMKVKNSPRLYKKLNRFYTENDFGYDSENGLNKKTKKYVVALKNMHEKYLEFQKVRKSLGGPAIPSIDPLGLADLTWTIITGISESKMNKVSGVSEVLDKLRIVYPPSKE